MHPREAVRNLTKLFSPSIQDARCLLLMGGEGEQGASVLLCLAASTRLCTHAGVRCAFSFYMTIHDMDHTNELRAIARCKTHAQISARSNVPQY
jgi:hypothetical protein